MARFINCSRNQQAILGLGLSATHTGGNGLYIDG